MKKVSKKDKWLILPLLMVALLGCQKKDSGSATPIADSKAVSSSFECSAIENGSLKIDSCLQKACEQFAQGKFKTESKSCECGPGKYFSGWENPSCLRFENEMNCFTEASGESKCQITNLLHSNGTSIGGLFIQSLSAENSLDEAEALIPNVDEIRWSPAIQHRYGNLTLLFGEGLLNQNQLSLLMEPSTAQPLAKYLSNFGPKDDLKYYSSAEDLKADLLGKKPADGGGLEFRQDSPAVSVIQAFLIAGLELFYHEDLKLVETYDLSTCLSYCRLQSQKEFALRKRAVLEVEYLGGVEWRRTIHLYDTNPRPFASIHLHANKSVSFVTIYKNEESEGSLIRKASLLNRFGMPIGVFSKTVYSWPELASSQRQLKQIQRSFETNVIICEGGFAPQQYTTGDLAGSLQMGPAVSNTPTSSGSYFGWMNSKDPDLFFQGVLQFNSNGFRQNSGQNYEAHSLEVTTLAVLGDRGFANSGIGFIPADLKLCRDQKSYETLKQTLQGRAKIINLSAVFKQTGDACGVIEKLPVQDPDHSFLWVMGAGNARLYNEEAVLQTCPQKFSSQANVIVVAASKNGKDLDQMSSGGSSFADIAASGEAAKSKGWGTSFAAPRVTHVAAQILQRYPQLTPEEIRLSILIGSEHVDELDVRSSGYLNQKFAVKMAGYFANPGNRSLEEAIGNVFCTYGASCRLQKKKMKILKERIRPDFKPEWRNKE